MNTKNNKISNEENKVVEQKLDLDFKIEKLEEWGITLDEAISEIEKITLPDFPLSFKEKSTLFAYMKRNNIDQYNLSEDTIESCESIICSDRQIKNQRIMRIIQKRRYLREVIRLLTKYDNLYDDMIGKSFEELMKMWENGDFEGRIPGYWHEDDVECVECIAQADLFAGGIIPEEECTSDII